MKIVVIVVAITSSRDKHPIPIVFKKIDKTQLFVSKMLFVSPSAEFRIRTWLQNENDVIANKNNLLLNFKAYDGLRNDLLSFILLQSQTHNFVSFES